MGGEGGNEYTIAHEAIKKKKKRNESHYHPLNFSSNAHNNFLHKTKITITISHRPIHQ